jgi:hypothetical protein
MLLTREDIQLSLELERKISDAADALLVEFRKTWITAMGIVENSNPAHYDHEMRVRELLQIGGRSLPDSCLSFHLIDRDTIEYEGDERWAYGGHEHYSYTLPTSYLFEDWRPGLLADIECAKVARATESEATRARVQEAEKAKLAELLEKYPNG